MRHVRNKMLLLLLLLSAIQGSIFRVNGPAHGWESSHKMYASNEGPFGYDGESSVRVLSTARLLVNSSTSRYDYGVAVAIYYVKEGPDYLNLCSLDSSSLSPQDIVSKRFEFANDSSLLVQMDVDFKVARKGNQKAVLQTCRRLKNSSILYQEYTTGDPTVELNATIAFRNPYGYLPALLYGLLPFNGIMSFIYLTITLLFIMIYLRHCRRLLYLHHFILLVLILSTAETISWYRTYVEMNQNGTPVCCPYPSPFLLSTILKVLARMISREVLLLISLGYGIIRPSLTWPEWGLLLSLGSCYAVSEASLKLTQSAQESQGESSPPLIWALLAISSNCVFAFWIFSALSATRSNLLKAKQTFKYDMYRKLVQVLVLFLSASFVLLVLEGSVYSKHLPLDWEWIWLLWATSDILNCLVLFTMGFIWRPCYTSSLYALSIQIPQSESDIEDIEDQDSNS